MNAIQLRILIWDVCNNDLKLRKLLTAGDIYTIQDIAVKFAVQDELIEIGPEPESKENGEL